MILEFRTTNGQPVGRVKVEGNTVVEVTPILRSIVDAWLRGHPAATFIEHHVGSNGYLTGFVIET